MTLPTGVPKPILGRLAGAVTRIVEERAFRQRLFIGRDARRVRALDRRGAQGLRADRTGVGSQAGVSVSRAKWRSRPSARATRDPGPRGQELRALAPGSRLSRAKSALGRDTRPAFHGCDYKPAPASWLVSRRFWLSLVIG